MYSHITYIYIFYLLLVSSAAQNLTRAVEHTGRTYEAIGDMYKEQVTLALIETTSTSLSLSLLVATP